MPRVARLLVVAGGTSEIYPDSFARLVQAAELVKKGAPCRIPSLACLLVEVG
jgi:hypothetical protein